LITEIIYQIDKSRDDSGMDTNSIRRENLRALAARYGTQAEFAAACGTAPSVISLIVSPNPKRNLGHQLARKIESAQGLPMGWLDSTHSKEPGETVDLSFLPAALAQKITSYRAVVEIERFDIAGSMGPGTEPPDMNMVVEHMSLDAGWVRQNLVYTAIENLKLISGRGDSMAPTIRSGDALIVDAGVTSVESDAIYFFLMRGQQHIKRIQRNLDGLTIISDNGQYREIDVPAEREGDIQVLAQIIYWWTGRSY
jgi:phage repressor protein C with HTH and peptisase S24 domain